MAHVPAVYEGYYSANAVYGTGSAIWLTPDGKEVSVTHVFLSHADATARCGWSDAVRVGKVVTFARRGKTASTV